MCFLLDLSVGVPFAVRGAPAGTEPRGMEPVSPTLQAAAPEPSVRVPTRDMGDTGPQELGRASTVLALQLGPGSVGQPCKADVGCAPCTFLGSASQDFPTSFWDLRASPQCPHLLWGSGWSVQFLLHTHGSHWVKAVQNKGSTTQGPLLRTLGLTPNGNPSHSEGPMTAEQ